MQQIEHGLQMELNVRVVALCTVAGTRRVRAKASLCMLRYILQGQCQGGAFASKVAFTPFVFISTAVVITVTFVIFGLAILKKRIGNSIIRTFCFSNFIAFPTTTRFSIAKRRIQNILLNCDILEG